MLKIIGHIILSVMMLVSATGMKINMHFCQGHLYDLAINAPVDSCCENDSQDHTCYCDHDIPMSHHCDDESINIESNPDFLTSSVVFDFENPISSELFGTSHLMSVSFIANHHFATRIFNYNKPPPQEVVLSQIQSYLN